MVSSLSNFLKKLSKWDYFPTVRMLAAVAISFAIVFILVFIVSNDPMNAIKSLFIVPLTSKRNFIDILSYMVPLVFTALGMNLVLKSGLFNLASDGALYMAASVAAVIAIQWIMPPGVAQLVIIPIAAIIGASINVVPALLQRLTGASALVISIMFNFIFFYLGQFLIRETVLDATTGNHSYPFREAARIPRIIPGQSLHWGFAIMLVMVVVMYFLVERSKFGYQLRITGLNRAFAKYSGIKVGSVVLAAQFIAGLLAGAGGAIQLTGMFERFNWNLLGQVTYVWDGMLVNILAVTKPQYILIAGFFLGYLRIGSNVMAMRTDVDSELITVIQGIMLVLISAERFLYFIRKRREEKLALEAKMQEEKDTAPEEEVV